MHRYKKYFFQDDAKIECMIQEGLSWDTRQEDNSGNVPEKMV